MELSTLLPLLLVLVVGLALGAAAGLAGGLAWGGARTAALQARADAAELAAARLRTEDAEDDRRAEAVASLVAPLAAQLARVEGQLDGLDRERVRSAAELREQVATVAAGSQRLEKETAALVGALRRPQARGRWGELHLRRVVELAGMLDRCDFEEQPAVRAEGALLRPDLLVRLPGGGTVVVDAKVTLAAYLEAVEADDEQVRASRTAAHAKHLRAHVDRLAEKAYWRQFPQAPDFVVLFLPGEAFLGPALEADPLLLEHASARRVHLATPTTLLSLLRAVAHGWRAQTLGESATQVLEAGTALLDRLGPFAEHVDKLGRSLTRSVTDFNATVGSLERTLLPSARRLAALAGQDAPAAPEVVGELVRPVTAPRLAVVAEHEPGTPGVAGTASG